MKYYGFSAKFTTQPGQRDELAAILLESADQLKDNEDCLQYLMSISDEPDSLYVTEIWKTKEAHDAALELEASKTLIRRAVLLIAGMSDRTETEIIGGKGLL